MVTDEQKKMIAGQMPIGYQREIAEKGGVSRACVSNWFTGRTKSRKVEYAVLDYYIEHKMKLEAKMKAAGLA